MVERWLHFPPLGHVLNKSYLKTDTTIKCAVISATNGETCIKGRSMVFL